MSTENLYNNPYQVSKLKRILRTQKIKYTFNRLPLNSFGEPDKDKQPIKIEIQGLFHMSSSHQTRTNADSTTIATNPQPMILALYEVAKTIKYGDCVVINNQKYKVVEVMNVNELNLFAEISLEVVKDE